jgi:hypothetical protein
MSQSPKDAMMEALKTSYTYTMAAYMAEKLGDPDAAQQYNGRASLSLSHADALYRNNNWSGQMDRWGTFTEYRRDAKQQVLKDLQDYLE